MFLILNFKFFTFFLICLSACNVDERLSKHFADFSSNGSLIITQRKTINDLPSQ